MHRCAVHRQTLYAARMGRHSLDENGVGPPRRGVVGRRAGAAPDAKMFFSVAKAQDRADTIAYPARRR